MIEGIKVQMSTEQLREHLNGRAKHHRTKAEFYKGQVTALGSGGVTVNNASNDPIRSLQSSQTEHEQKTALFTMLAENLIPNETYRLADNDLSRLELISRYF